MSRQRGWTGMMSKRLLTRHSSNSSKRVVRNSGLLYVVSGVGGEREKVRGMLLLGLEKQGEG